MSNNKNNKNTKKIKSGIFDFKKSLYILFLGLMILPLLYFIGVRIEAAEHRLISFSVIAIIGGAIFEARRIAENWKNVIFKLLLAFALSFLCFLPGRRELSYSFDDKITLWPYYFLGLFVLVSMAIHDKKITKKLDEGVTLIQSTALLYWVIDGGILTQSNILLTIVGVFAVLFSIFALFHALTYTQLTNRHRLLLSIGSSIIMVFFAANYTYNIFQNGDVEESVFAGDMLYNLTQYFLLGISAIYMVHNLYMLLQFLPEKHNFFNERYFAEVKELQQKHIERYSQSQVKISISVIFLLLSGIVFYANYYFKLVPSHVAIWIVFVLFPVIAFIQNKRDKKYTTNIT